jgi:tetratricopeptide (TPR) repeat protein
LTEHPSREELAALNREVLRPERERAVWRHVLTPCMDCLAAVPSPVRLLLGLESRHLKRTAEEDVACDAAIGRAFKAALKHERNRQAQKAQVQRALRVLEDGGVGAVLNLPQNMGELARMETFLARSWALRHEDPKSMVDLAWFAAQVSLRLDPVCYGPAQVSDFQARAHAELGNAYRVSDRLHEACDFLGRARVFFERGTGDEVLEVRLLELEGSLAADCRQFGRASKTLLKVLKFYNEHSAFHLAGRTLIKIGLYAGYAGDFDKAIQLLEKGLALVDGGPDPDLASAAAHNLTLFLIDSGRFREAKKLRIVHSRHLADAGGRVNAVKFRALEGRIDSGLGNYQRAIGIFQEVRRGYEEVGRPYEAAIADLDLAAVLLAQGKAAEATRVALEAAGIFTSLQIQREAFQAVILLRDAFEGQAATLEMVEEVAGFLRRIEIDPALRFEGQAWEGPGR